MGKKTAKQKKQMRRILRIKSAIKSKKIDTTLIFRCSNRYLHAQVVRVTDGHTLLSAASNEDSFTIKGKNKQVAEKLGSLIAERSLKSGIERVFFDRRGKKYHGRVASFCQAAREKGLQI